MKTEMKKMNRRLGRVGVGVGVGALSVMLAANSAAAYRCGMTVVAGNDGTVTVQGSGAPGGTMINLTSDCFAPVTVPTASDGTFSTKVAVYSSVAPGSTCSVAADTGIECTGTFRTPQSSTPTTQPPVTTTAPPTPDQGGNGAPTEATTTTVQVLGNNTDNTDADPATPGASSESGKLPFTGVETAGLVTAGALMVAGGALLVSGVRRRQSA